MMDDPRKPTSRESGIRRFFGAVWRSMVSTATIGIVAVGVFVFREGYFSVRIFRDVVVENGPIFAALFLGLVMWNLWFR